MLECGTALQKIRAEQMVDIVAEGQVNAFVPEFAQLVLMKITILKKRFFKYEFLDGGDFLVKL